MCLTLTRTIERPSPHTPAILMAVALEELHIEATLDQLALLWGIWRENISRRGRSAAGLVGVWGLLTRNANVKRNSFEAKSVSMRIRDAERPGATLLRLQARALRAR